MLTLLNKMNRSSRVMAALIFLTAAGNGPSYAGETAVPASQTKTYTWGEKLKRGALNIISSPVEVARQIHITSSETDLLEGWTLGLAKGVGHGVLRLGAGLVDVLTFPFDFPKAHKAPLVNPEYVWEKPGVKYTSL